MNDLHHRISVLWVTVLIAWIGTTSAEGAVRAGRPADLHEAESSFHRSVSFEFPAVEGWELQVNPMVYTPDNLYDLINGAAMLYLEYDFVDLHLAEYTGPGELSVHAELYRHSSPVNAYGIYTTERSPDYHFIELGAEAYLEEGVLNCYTGSHYIKLYSNSRADHLQASLKKIAGQLIMTLGQSGGKPAMVTLFPEQGKIPHTDVYVRKNFIGFEFLHSAFAQSYEGGYRLFIIEGKDRSEIMDMLKQYLAFTRQEDVDPEIQDAFIIKDKYNGDIRVNIKGRHLAGILDDASSEDALQNLRRLTEALPAE